MATAMVSLDAKRPYRFRLASRTLRAQHAADFGTAVSLGNVCRSLLYELLDVLSPDLAAVLPGARTAFFLGRYGQDRWVGLFPDGGRSHVRRMGLRSLHCLRKNSNPGSQDVYGRGTGGGWDLACCLRRKRASALGSMSAVGGGVLGNQRFQYLGNYSNARGTASSWQVDRAAKLLRQSGGMDRASGDGFGRGQDGTVLLGFHHHCGHRFPGLAVLDIYCRCSSTGGLVNSPALRRFGLISWHAANAVGSEQTFRAALKEVACTGSAVYISSSKARCSSEVSETKHEHTSSTLWFLPHPDLDRHTPALSPDRDCHGFHRGRIRSGHSEARSRSR